MPLPHHATPPGDRHVVAVLAFNEHDATDCCLGRIRASGFSGDLVLVDNGSRPAMDGLARVHGCRYVRHAVNRMVNPVWNDLLREPADWLSLVNNDCVVRDAYLDEVPVSMRREGLAVAAPTLIEVPDILSPDLDVGAEPGPVTVARDALRDGHVMTIDLAAWRCHGRPIPRVLKVWFGDDSIWARLRLAGLTCARLGGRTYYSESGHGNSGRTVVRHAAIRAQIAHEEHVRARCRALTQASVVAGALDGGMLRYHEPPPGVAGWLRQRYRDARQWYWLR